MWARAMRHFGVCANPGATGLYPVELTTSFFQTVYPIFPFTYGINAMRECICGFYGNMWLGFMGVLRCSS